MKKIILKCFLSFMFFLPVFSKENTTGSDSLNLNNSSLLSINNVSMWARSDGVLAKGPNYINGVVYPKGTASVIYTDGFLWGGFVHDNRIPSLRAGGSLYVSGLTPGKILSGGIRESIDPSERTIWNIRKDYETADLTETARILFNYTDTTHPTVEEINKVRKMYKESWKTWPWQKGAPFYDKNNNGIMDQGEKPGLLNADQVVWFVCNDEDAYKCCKFLGSPPFGIELQVTLWAYNRKGGNMEQALQQTVFRRYRFIYKGTEDTPDSARIDSMFVSMWSDCEIGNRLDDYVGCDTLLDLMFGYNSSTIDGEFEKYNLSPPAAGYAFLQGPIVFTGNSRDKALCVSGEKYLYKNLNMSVFNYFAGDFIGTESSIFQSYSVYEYTLQWYNLMNGLGSPLSTPFDRLRVKAQDNALRGTKHEQQVML